MDSQAVSFRVDKDDFANAVGWVARSLPAKPAQPVLRGMVITASDEGLELAGFDYEVSTQVKIPAEVNEAGRIAVLVSCSLTSPRCCRTNPWSYVLRAATCWSPAVPRVLKFL